MILKNKFESHFSKKKSHLNMKFRYFQVLKINFWINFKATFFCRQKDQIKNLAHFFLSIHCTYIENSVYNISSLCISCIWCCCCIRLFCTLCHHRCHDEGGKAENNKFTGHIWGKTIWTKKERQKNISFLVKFFLLLVK